MRTYFFIFAIFLIAVMENSRAETTRNPIVGGLQEQDVNSQEYHNKLKKVLQTQNSEVGVKKITRIQTQVVAGQKYIIDFVSLDDKNCKVSWVEQPWISEQPQYVEFSCANNVQRSGE